MSLYGGGRAVHRVTGGTFRWEVNSNGEAMEAIAEELLTGKRMRVVITHATVVADEPAPSTPWEPIQVEAGQVYVYGANEHLAMWPREFEEWFQVTEVDE